MRSGRAFKQSAIDAVVRLFNGVNSKKSSASDFIGCALRAVTNLKKRMAVTSAEDVIGVIYQL